MEIKCQITNSDVLPENAVFVMDNAALVIRETKRFGRFSGIGLD